MHKKKNRHMYINIIKNYATEYWTIAAAALAFNKTNIQLNLEARQTFFSNRVREVPETIHHK